MKLAENNPFGKPLVVALDMYGNDLYYADEAAKLRRQFVTSGIPAYPSLNSAARALDRYIKYHEFQAKGEGA